MPCAPGPAKPVDWERIDNFLAREIGVLPTQADQMTLAEILVLLEDGKGEQHSTQQMRESVDAWRGMTARERLESRRKG